MDIIIRPERPEDHYAAELMTQRAFWNLYAPGCDEHYLVHRLRSADCYLPELSRVAEYEGKIVGAVYYSKCIVRCDDGREIDILTFGPLCVDPDYQNRGIGGALLRQTMDLARQAGHKGIIIFGEAGYYPRFGFVTCDKLGITTEDGANFDAFMGVELQPDALSGVTGRFFEASVFSDLPKEEVEEFNRKFPHMEKLVLPGQWK